MSEEVRGSFDSRALVQAWLDVERALAEAEAEVGVIPAEAAARIGREADASLYDLTALRRGIAESQHPLVPLVRALAERCGYDGGWVHWGATTQDVIDTGETRHGIKLSLYLFSMCWDRRTIADDKAPRTWAEYKAAAESYPPYNVEDTGEGRGHHSPRRARQDDSEASTPGRGDLRCPVQPGRPELLRPRASGFQPAGRRVLLLLVHPQLLERHRLHG